MELFCPHQIFSGKLHEAASSSSLFPVAQAFISTAMVGTALVAEILALLSFRYFLPSVQISVI